MGVLDPFDVSMVTPTGRPSSPFVPSASSETPPDKPSAQPKPEKVAATPTKASAPASVKVSGVDDALKQVGALEQRRAEMMPPKLELPQKPQTAKDDIQLWGALAIAFAGLASLRTRQPMTSALNAASAALNGMREGQKEKADQAYKEWEQQTRMALESASYEQRAYEEVMNNMTHREEVALSGGKAKDESAYRADEMKLKTMQAALQDAQSTQVFEEGKARGGFQEGVRAVAELQEQRRKQADLLKQATGNVGRWQNKVDATKAMENSPEWKEAIQTGDWRKQVDMLADIETKFSAKGTQPGRMLTDEQLDSNAKATVAGKMAPPSTANVYGARAKPDAMVEWQKIRELDPDYDPNLWDLKKQALKQLEGPDGEQIKSFTVLLHHLEFMDELSKKLQTTDQRLWNTVTNQIAVQFGMPEITNFDMAKQIVGAEAVKAIVGNAATGGERTGLEDVFDPKNSPEQMQGVLASTKTLVTGQLAGKLSKYRKLIDKGWLTDDDIVPQETLDKYGFSSIKDKSKVLAPGGRSLLDRWNIPGGDESVPAPTTEKVSDEKPAKDQTKNIQQTIKDNKWQTKVMVKGRPAYSVDGVWYFEDGTPAPMQ